MGNAKLLRDKILDKFDQWAKGWSEFTQKLSNLSKNINLKFLEVQERFEELSERFQIVDDVKLEILDDLQTKKLIQGNMDFRTVDDFAKTLWLSHDMAQELFAETKNQRYYELAMETMMVIRELEQIKEYLAKHGK